MAVASSMATALGQVIFGEDGTAASVACSAGKQGIGSRHAAAPARCCPGGACSGGWR